MLPPPRLRHRILPKPQKLPSSLLGCFLESYESLIDLNILMYKSVHNISDLSLYSDSSCYIFGIIFFDI